uniref:Uncharacterized protein n=1 Tax=Arundo donax TaxID=35708 RepID=A0A0A8Z025_ARUDO
MKSLRTTPSRMMMSRRLMLRPHPSYLWLWAISFSC